MRAVWLAALVLAASTAPAAAWTDDRQVPGSGSLFPFPVGVAVGDDGTAAVVWRHQGDMPAKARVRVAVRTPAGNWARTRTLSPRGVAGTTVAVDGRGRVLVAWVQMHPRKLVTVGPYLIRLATRDRRGRWRTVTLGRSGHFVEAAPRIAANRRGDAVVVWRGGHEHSEAILASFRRARGSFGPAEAIRDGAPTVRTGQQVALDARGRAYAAWTAGDEVHVAQRSTKWSKGRRLASAASAPAIATDARGEVFVAWRQSGAIAFTGSPFAPPRLFTTSSDPVLAVSAAGASLLAWSPPLATGPYHPELHYVLGLGAERVLDGAAVGAIAPLPHGAFAVASADVAGVTIRELAGNGLFGPSHRIAAVGSSPQLASAGSRALLVWFHENALRYSVRDG